MGLPVAEVLQLGALQGTRLLAGREGIGRVVTDVTVLEVPRDFEPWLRGGELILTTLYHLRGDRRGQVEVVDSCAKGGAAALAIHPFRDGGQVCDELIEAADAHHLPLMLIPGTLPYAAVISSVLGAILNRQSYILKRSEEINRELTRLILQGSGVHAIAAAVARLIGQPVLITDHALEPLATGTAAVAHRAFLQRCLQSPDYLDAVAALRSRQVSAQLKSTGEFVTFKVKVGGRLIKQVVVQASVGQDVYGYIMTWETGGEMEELDFVALSHAATALALEMVKARAVAETENRLKSDFLSEVFSGRFRGEEELLRRGRLMGMDLARKHMILLARFDAGPDDAPSNQELVAADPRLHALVQRSVDRVCPRSLAVPRGDTVVILLHFERPPAPDAAHDKGREVARAVQGALAEEFPGVRASIGIGEICRSPLDLGKSYREALQALDVGVRLFGKGNAVAIQDLGVFGVLGAVDQGPVGEYVRRVLQQLLEYDGRNNTDLLRTLEVYLDEKESLIAAARRLYVHPNTVRYRIEKIREVLKVDLFASPEQRLSLHLALKCRHLLQ